MGVVKLSEGCAGANVMGLVKLSEDCGGAK